MFNDRVNCPHLHLQYAQLRQVLEVGLEDDGDVVALQVSERNTQKNR